MRSKIFTLFILFTCLLILGCSGQDSDNPITFQQPVAGNNAGIDCSTQIPAIDESQNNRELLGLWSMFLDLESNSVKVEPNRNLMSHFNVTRMIRLPIVVLEGWSPTSDGVDVSVKVGLTNHYTLSGYDVRLIIYTDDVGHLLLNADDWSMLFDIPEGDSRNPFKTYAKDVVNREFEGYKSHGPTILWEYLTIRCPYSNLAVSFAVDASFPGNCKEPYEINNFNQENPLSNVGSITDVTVDVLDWQNDVNSVSLECPDISTNPVIFEYQGGVHWLGQLINEIGAPAGEYDGWIAVKSTNSEEISLYDKVLITVTIGTPDNMELINTVSLPSATDARRISVSNGIACIAGGAEGVYILDVDPPESAYVINDLPFPLDLGTYCKDVEISNGYAYAVGGYYYYKIAIDPPESAYIVDSTFCHPNEYEVLDVSDGYLYLAYSDLRIVDIQTWVTVKDNIPLSGQGATGMDVVNGYAYVVASGNGGVTTVDVDPPTEAHTVGSRPGYGTLSDINVFDQYAIIASLDDRPMIWSILPPYDPSFVTFVQNATFGSYALKVSDDFAYVGRVGILYTVDLKQPESAIKFSELNIPGSDIRGVDVFNNYAYLSDSNSLSMRIVELW